MTFSIPDLSLPETGMRPAPVDPDGFFLALSQEMGKIPENQWYCWSRLSPDLYGKSMLLPALRDDSLTGKMLRYCLEVVSGCLVATDSPVRVQSGEKRAFSTLLSIIKLSFADGIIRPGITIKAF